MKFMVIKKQLAEGCDYSIGCGMRYDVVEAKTEYDAILQSVYDDPADLESFKLQKDRDLAEAYIVPMSEVKPIDLGALRAAHVAHLRAEELNRPKAAEETELETYHRLRRKFGDK